MALKTTLSILFALSLFNLSLSAHEGEGETSIENEATNEPLPPCARPLEELHTSIEEVFGEGYTVYINCLSFDAEGALRIGVASGESSEGPDRRFVIECLGGILVAQPEMTSSPIDRTDIRNTSCLECNTSLASGLCRESEFGPHTHTHTHTHAHTHTHTHTIEYNYIAYYLARCILGVCMSLLVLPGRVIVFE